MKLCGELEFPLRSNGGDGIETMHSCKVVRQFHFTTDAEVEIVVYPAEAIEVNPQLGFREEREVVFLTLTVSVLFLPEIRKTCE